MQGQTVEKFVVVEEVLPDAVDDQMKQLMLLVEEQGHGEVPDLLLGVLVRRDEIDCLEMAEVDVPTEDIYV
jgi:hypothetical protein